MDLETRNKVDLALNAIALSETKRHDFYTENYLESMLDNMRDVKRFVNVIKLNFDFVVKELDLIDYFILVLIQIRRFDIYELLSKSELVEIKDDVSGVVTLKEAEWERYRNNSQEQLGFREFNILDSCIRFLLENSSSKSSRKISNIENYWLYFSFQLFESISYNEFTNAVNGSPKNLLLFLKRMRF